MPVRSNAPDGRLKCSSAHQENPRSTEWPVRDCLHLPSSDFRKVFFFSINIRDTNRYRPVFGLNFLSNFLLIGNKIRVE